MKKITLAFLGFLLFSCMQPLEKSSTTQDFIVKGTINGDFDGYIKIKYDEQMDSSIVENNTFQFEGKVSSPKAFQFQFDSLDSSEIFYLENDTLVFDIIVDEEKLENEIIKTYEVKQLSGGKTQQLKADFNKFLNKTSRSKINRDVILNKMDSIIKANPNHDYLGKVLSDLSMKQDLLYNDVRSLISKMDVDELYADDIGLLERYQQKRRNYQIGSEIPSFELISITSKPSELKENFSKYNLIYFWSSWCENCKTQQQKLKDIYQKFNFKGFEIVGISVDTNREDWITSLSHESLPWTSLRVENGFTGDIASEMGIVDLPQYYLVDQKGRIIEINLSMDELTIILNALLN